jgi:hypothetical protein
MRQLLHVRRARGDFDADRLIARDYDLADLALGVGHVSHKSEAEEESGENGAKGCAHGQEGKMEKKDNPPPERCPAIRDGSGRSGFPAAVFASRNEPPASLRHFYLRRSAA